MKQDRRGSWYLLTGLILGVGMGLAYSWLVSPVKYVDAPPYALRADYKDEYRALIASAYQYNDDLVRAEQRLAQLKDDNPVHVLALQAQQAHAEGHPLEEVQALNSLSLALGGLTTPVSTALPSAPQLTSEPAPGQASPTPLMSEPTPSQELVSSTLQTMGTGSVPLTTGTTQPYDPDAPSSEHEGSYLLEETRMLCDIGQPSPLLQVDIRDSAGQPVPGVEVLVSWESGEDHFFTGLQPEVDLGYGDFMMLPGEIYSLRFTGAGQAIDDLTPSECVADDGSSYWGSWFLIFIQQ